MLGAILGGPRWLPLGGELVRVAELTIGHLIEMARFAEAATGGPFALPPHDDPRVWWMAVVRRAKAAEAAEATPAYLPPPGVDPASWWSLGLSLSTGHPDPGRLGEWLAGEGSPLQQEVAGAWAGRSPYRTGLAVLDAIEGVQYGRPPEIDLRRACKAVGERFSPAEIRSMTPDEFWGAASGYAAWKARPPIDRDPWAFTAGRQRLGREAEAWLSSLAGHATDRATEDPD